MNSNPNSQQCATQKALILAHLSKGHSLTPLEALDRFGCLRLGARIWDIRRDGYVVKSEMKKTNTGKYVAEYKLIPKEQNQQP